MLLAIDSASPACSVALLDGDEIVYQRHEIVGRGHAERLVPMIEALLAGRVPDAIAVDCGPGSFTGVRVGLAAAHGLSIGWGVPLTGFSSMSALAAAARADGEIAVALNGGHGQLFVQSFRHDPLQSIAPLRALTPEDAAAVTAEERVFGSGAAALVAARGWGAAADLPLRAADVARLPEALRRLDARPIYGREPDARVPA